MTLREQLVADVPVFLHTDEFATQIAVEVDGDLVSCILDESEAPRTEDGVTLREFALYVATTALTLPRVGQRMVIDGKQANVTSVAEDAGIVTVRLRWFDS